MHLHALSDYLTTLLQLQTRTVRPSDYTGRPTSHTAFTPQHSVCSLCILRNCAVCAHRHIAVGVVVTPWCFSFIISADRLLPNPYLLPFSTISAPSHCPHSSRNRKCSKQSQFDFGAAGDKTHCYVVGPTCPAVAAPGLKAAARSRVWSLPGNERKQRKDGEGATRCVKQGEGRKTKTGYYFQIFMKPEYSRQIF